MKVRGEYAKSESTRALILDAALAEALEVGFLSASIAKIAARAGLSTGIINYHFGSRGELLKEAMTIQVVKFMDFSSAPTSEDTFFTYVRRLIIAYVQFLRANPNYRRLSEEVRHHDPEIYASANRVHVERIIQGIQWGIGRGDLAPLNKEGMLAKAYFLLGTMSFLDRLLEDPACLSDELIADTFVSLLEGGLSPVSGT